MTKARSNATANAAKGDLTVGTGTNLSGVLSAGNNGEALVLDSSTATGLKWAPFPASGMTNPMTTTGDTIYSSSGSTPARLGIGSSGQVLTVSGGVPTWAAPSSAKSSFSLLSSTSLSGSSSVTISGLSGYDKLFFVISNLSASAGSFFVGVRFNGDTAGNYTFAGVQHLVANNYAQSFISNTQLKFGETPNGAADQMQGFISLTGANSTGTKMMTMNSAGNNSGFQGYSGGGNYAGTSVISSFTIYITGSTFDLGTIYTYGSVA